MMNRSRTLLSIILSTIALCLFLEETSALVTPPSSSKSSSSLLFQKSSTSLHQASDSDSSKPPETAVELFDSESWKIIKKDLDAVPIFCVANKEGKPVAYSITVKKTQDEDEDAEPITFQVPFFYVDVEDAKTELKKVRDSNKEKAEEMDLIPFPLGSAFEMWSNDQAVIIPSGKAVQQAGAPPGTNPIGQAVPLFCCMEIMQETEVKDAEGNIKMAPVLPLFMVLEECNAAVDQAVEMDGGTSDDFEVASLSLTAAIEQLATQIKGVPGFQVMPPQASLEYINNYLSSSSPP
ncbi:unnamed protein product [Cylindrotheca closterium]|uniref:Uncharacterized protein n=1 Tax=Cylindrotheca closterium TaxID=2856 RepID=A0AAD2G5V7_9STRA|nr:unnamed protein product [Cylindrotheca closterium]